MCVLKLSSFWTRGWQDEHDNSYEFIPVILCATVFVYVLPAQNVWAERFIPGVSSPRVKSFAVLQKLASVSCKGWTTTCFGTKSCSLLVTGTSSAFVVIVIQFKMASLASYWMWVEEIVSHQKRHVKSIWNQVVMLVWNSHWYKFLYVNSPNYRNHYDKAKPQKL